ncbi:MAG: hypothetical protein QXE01_08775, partial [Sulfolobales archaeon]
APKYIYEKSGERSLDLEDLVLRAFRETLNLDPVEVAKAGVEIAEKSPKEVKEYIVGKDPAQGRGRTPR